MLRRVLGIVGRVLTATGVLVLLFVVYQLWGTSLVEARAQNALEDDFATVLAAPEPPPPESEPSPVATAPATTTSTSAPESLHPEEGSAVARLEIPAIGVDKIVVEGVSQPDLRRGPGHYPGTPLPGQAGNAAIAGHRTTYGAPFYRLDELEPGDVIRVTTRDGVFEYEVTGSEVVAPTRVDVLNDFGDDRLTLTTCNPRYSAAQRLIVTARLDRPPVATAAGSTDRRIPATTAPATAPAEALTAGSEIGGSLDGSSAALFPALLWGFATAGTAAVIWLAGRRWRRWPAYALGVVPFLIVLFVFFENLNRLLPPSV